MTNDVFNPSDRIAHVRQQVTGLAGVKRFSDTAVMVCCPFHADSSPSGRISLNPARPRSIGWYRCYACGDRVSMPWNEFAERTSLQPFGPPPDIVKAQFLNEEHYDEELLDGNGNSDKQERIDLFPLDRDACEKLHLPTTVWREYSFKLLRSIGAHLCYAHPKKPGYRGRYYVYLPVDVNGERVGYIKAQPTKPEDKRWPSYLNKPGQWSSTHGLFLFDQSVALMHREGLKTLVLTEGPRDGLRLYREGIPAVSLLGTQSWTRVKAMTVALSGAERLIVCLDGDSAGRTATRLIVTGLRRKDEERQSYSPPDLRTLVDSVKIFKLWEYAARDGVDKYDAHSSPPDVIDDLRALLR